jgi:hypothetical protein
MATRRTLSLSQAQYDELQHALHTHPKAYIRERAAALLKIAAGDSPHHVARHGLLQPRSPDMVYTWLDRYEADGLQGLYLRPGRGRKPAFSPSVSAAWGGPDGGAPGDSARSPHAGLLSQSVESRPASRGLSLDSRFHGWRAEPDLPPLTHSTETESGVSPQPGSPLSGQIVADRTGPTASLV